MLMNSPCPLGKQERTRWTAGTIPHRQGGAAATNQVYDQLYCNLQTVPCLGCSLSRTLASVELLPLWEVLRGVPLRSERRERPAP